MLQRARIPANEIVFAQAVDAKGQSIDLFAAIQGSAIMIHAPEYAAIFPVDKMSGKIFISPLGKMEVLRFPGLGIGRAEGPEDAAIEDSALGRLGMDDIFAVYLPVKPALCRIGGLLHPVAQDSCQFFVHLLPVVREVHGNEDAFATLCESISPFSPT